MGRSHAETGNLTDITRYLNVILKFTRGFWRDFQNIYVRDYTVFLYLYIIYIYLCMCLYIYILETVSHEKSMGVSDNIHPFCLCHLSISTMHGNSMNMWFWTWLFLLLQPPIIDLSWYWFLWAKSLTTSSPQHFTECSVLTLYTRII